MFNSRISRRFAGKAYRMVSHLCLWSLLGGFCLTGCAPLAPGPVPAASPEPPDRQEHVKQGDVVTVEVTASLEDGRLLYTTREQIASDPKIPKMEGYVAPEQFLPEEVVAGKSSAVPGLAQAVLGMSAGENRVVTVPAEEAFEPVDPKLRREFPCEKVIPIGLEMTAERFVQMTGGFPVEEQELALSPYVRTRVARVGENSVTLEMQAENGQTYEEAFGTVEVIVEGEEIRTRLTPKIGADFQFENRTGRIVASDGASFTVDFNPAVANKALMLDLEVLSRVPADTYADRTIFWHEELATGLEAARQENKPAVLVLYADWCTWCERMLDESMEDPRVKGLTDRFVWMKINSDVEQQFKERFGQKSFPMVVYFAPDGTILQQAEGFKDGNTLHRELRALSEAR